MNENSTIGFSDVLYCISTFTYSFSTAVTDTATIALYDLTSNTVMSSIQPTQTSLGVAGEKYAGAITGLAFMATPGPTTQGDLIALRIHQSVSVGVTLSVTVANLQCYDMVTVGFTTEPILG